MVNIRRKLRIPIIMEIKEFGKRVENKGFEEPFKMVCKVSPIFNLEMLWMVDEYKVTIYDKKRGRGYIMKKKFTSDEPKSGDYITMNVIKMVESMVWKIAKTGCKNNILR